MPEIYDTPVLTNTPFNLEAEQSVLGAAIIDQSTIPMLTGYIKPESFFRETHKDLFRCIVQMHNDGKTVDFITVMEKAVEKQVFDAPEDAKMYLATLCQLVPTTTHAEDYAKIVQRHYCTRQLAEIAESIMGQINDGTADPQAMLDASEQRLYQIRQGESVGGEQRGVRPIQTAVLSAYDRLQKISGEEREKFIGLRTGFSELDKMLGGLNRSDLLVVAGRPGWVRPRSRSTSRRAWLNHRRKPSLSSHLKCHQTSLRCAL